MTELKGKEAKQRLGVLIQEIESKKEMLDTLLNSANQIKGQLDSVSSDVNTKIGNVNNLENQITQKASEISQILTDTQNKQEEITKQKDSAEAAKAHIDTLEKALGELEEKAQLIQSQSETLRNQIETELHAGVTSVNLSKSFADKVTEYHKNSKFWSVFFVLLMLALLVYYGAATFSVEKILNLQDVWRHLIFRSPFWVFGIWLAIFFGNRRAESKKLEELYKHKEVMARSFVGYRQTLIELGDEDKALLKEHMGNLLKAMNENSATFLNTEGDKHPLIELLASYLSQGKKKENMDTEKE